MSATLLGIPLFPLHVVLFPGMALPLHVFEPRYRRMTSDCLDSNLPIGIVLALPGSVQGHEIPAPVGTFARIVDYERLPDGRYNLLTVGTQLSALSRQSVRAIFTWLPRSSRWMTCPMWMRANRLNWRLRRTRCSACICAPCLRCLAARNARLKRLKRPAISPI